MTTPIMRAKMQIGSVSENKDKSTGETYNEQLSFYAVNRNEVYPEDGSDENNTYAKYSPSASLQITIANPVLFGKFKQGDTFYVDFTPVISQ